MPIPAEECTDRRSATENVKGACEDGHGGGLRNLVLKRDEARAVEVGAGGGSEHGGGQIRGQRPGSARDEKSGGGVYPMCSSTEPQF